MTLIMKLQTACFLPVLLICLCLLPAISRAEAESPLADTVWQLVSFQSMDDAIGTKRPQEQTLYTMHLRRDGTVKMTLNCNLATGTWTAKPAGGASGQFTFGPLAATRALCPPPSLDEEIVAQATYIRSYLLKDGRLHLSLMADGGIYTWEPVETAKPPVASYSAPEEGGPRNWQVTGAPNGLNLRDRPSTTTTIIAKFKNDTVLDNLGCQQNEKRTWCEVQPLGGGPLGYVAADFLQPAISPNGTFITGPDDSALRAGQGDFDANGEIPCGQVRGQPMTRCAFGVSRAGGGYATVVITMPDGRQRIVFFRMGQAIGADSSEADRSGPFRAERESDLNLIRVGEERYEIPDAVILGG